MPVNTIVLRVFGPVLVLTGAGGLVIPERYALMSGAVPYAVFHIVFGAAGTALAFTAGDGPCRAFNAVFGLIDLYQFAASLKGWPPKDSFRWTKADDALHLVLGLALVLVGLFAPNW